MIDDEAAKDDTKPFPFPTKDEHPSTAPAVPQVQTPSEATIDQGVEETFPASDPISVTSDKAHKPKE